jgi:carbamoylphosphate synthase large subunit
LAFIFLGSRGGSSCSGRAGAADRTGGEFDYPAPAIKALREEGIVTVLEPNIAIIQTSRACRSHLSQRCDPEFVEKIIIKEGVDAIAPVVRRPDCLELRTCIA